MRRPNPDGVPRVAASTSTLSPAHTHEKGRKPAHITHKSAAAPPRTACKDPQARTQARRSQHQHTRLIYSQPCPRLRRTPRRNTQRAQPPQQAENTAPHRGRNTSTSRPRLRVAMLALTAALLTAAATTAARRDTTFGCESKKDIQRAPIEQPWNIRSAPKEYPKRTQRAPKAHNHTQHQGACMHCAELTKVLLSTRTPTMPTRNASQTPHIPPRAADGRHRARRNPAARGPARAPVRRPVHYAVRPRLAEGRRGGRPGSSPGRRWD